MNTFVYMNIIPMGSCEILIGMDWLEAHHAILNYHNKTYSCLDEEGNQVIVRGMLRVISLRQVTALQMKKSFSKRMSAICIRCVGT